jgi:hypothetical protein
MMKVGFEQHDLVLVAEETAHQQPADTPAHDGSLMGGSAPPG